MARGHVQCAPGRQAPGLGGPVLLSAFRFRNAYGFQFYREATREIVCGWFADREDGPDSYTIDLTGLAPLPGFDCVITASADGVFDDLDPYDPDGSLTIGILQVEPSPQGQGCTLHIPSGACSLVVGMDANPILGP